MKEILAMLALIEVTPPANVEATGKAIAGEILRRRAEDKAKKASAS